MSTKAERDREDAAERRAAREAGLPRCGIIVAHAKHVYKEPSIKKGNQLRTCNGK